MIYTRKNTVINIGIIGLGIVGNALFQWIKKNNDQANISIYDPAKGYTQTMDGCEVVFIQVPVPTMDNGLLDSSILQKSIDFSGSNKTIVIRSTITPGLFGVLESLGEKTNNKIVYMPEFLSDLTAEEDFSNQELTCTFDEDLFRRIFPGRRYIKMTSREAILAKYTHNVFGALKVTYFNAVHDLADRLNVDYGNVLRVVLGTDHISKIYTDVPGHDGKFGYGGKCFPKDIKAFEREFRYTPMGELLNPIQSLNEGFRNGR